MGRIRTIKPDFFTHDGLAELSALHRLLFIGLWTLADREGRLEDRPKRIKIALLPWEECDVHALLWDLHHAGFIQRYEAAGLDCIQIGGFVKHQRPHPKESAIGLPNPPSREVPRTKMERSDEAHVVAGGKGREGDLRKEILENGKEPASAAAVLELKPTSSDPQPRARSEALQFFDAFQGLRQKRLGLVPEADPPHPQVNAWFGRAIALVGLQRLQAAIGKYLLTPKDRFWADKGFPFQGFMSDKVWRQYVPPEEKIG